MIFVCTKITNIYPIVKLLLWLNTSSVNVQEIASISFLYSIRATAGLLYWFAANAGLLNIGFAVNNTGVLSFGGFYHREVITQQFPITEIPSGTQYSGRIAGDPFSLRSHYELSQNNSKFFSWSSDKHLPTAQHQNDFTLKLDNGDFNALYNPAITNQSPTFSFLYENGLINPPTNARIEVKNPWLVNPLLTDWSHIEQKDEFLPYPIPYQTLSIIFSDRNGGMFLNAGIPTYLKPPYYSLRASKALDLTTMNHKTSNYSVGDWVFSHWISTDADLLTGPYLDTDGYDSKAIIFRSSTATVTGYYKAHRLSQSSSTPTSKNSQRKVTVGANGIHHATYESGGIIYYIKSTDRGSTWSPEEIVSDRNSICTKPSISENGGCVYIVYISSTVTTTGTTYDVVLRGGACAYWRTVYSRPIQSPQKCQPVISIMSPSYQTSCNEQIIFMAWEDNTSNNKKIIKCAALNNRTVLIDNELLVEGTQLGPNQLEPLYPSIASIQTMTQNVFHIAWFEAGSIFYAPITFYCANSQIYISGWNAVNGLTGIETVHDKNNSIGLFYPATAGPSVAVSPAIGRGDDNTVVVAFDIEPHFSFANPPKWFLVRERFDNIYTTSWLTTGTIVSSKYNTPTYMYPSVGTSATTYRTSSSSFKKSDYIRVVYNSNANSCKVAKFNGNYLDILPLSEPGRDPNMTGWSDQLGGFLSVYSGYANAPFTNSVLSTQNNLFKTMTSEVFNQRAIVAGVDTAAASLIVGSIKLLSQGNQETMINWDSADDSLLIGVNTTVAEKMRTASFTVPQNSSLIFGRTAAAMNGNQFPQNSNFLIQVRNVSDSSVLLTNQIAIASLSTNPDSAQQSIDLSLLAGSAVFVTFGLSDNIPVNNVNILDIYSLDNPYQSKRRIDNPNIQLPSTVTLDQNYPNPFGRATFGNPSTEISYSLPEGNNIKLSVIDALGREVAILVNEYKAPGMYTTTFNGENHPSGIYYYRLLAGNTTLTRKMSLVK